VSGAHAAALAAGCCCTAGGDTGEGSGDCPQILNAQPRTPADSTIDSVNVALTLVATAITTNEPQSIPTDCTLVPEEAYPEIAIANASGGAAEWQGDGWYGCGTGGATVTPLQHGITRRLCGSICGCNGNLPGCSLIACCGGSHAIPRSHRLPASFVTYQPDEIVQQQVVSCPPCCGGDGPVDVGTNVTSWISRMSVTIRYGCIHLPDWEVARPCNCPASDFATQYGYNLLVRVAIYSAGIMAANPSACPPPALINTPSSSLYGAFRAWYAKPCCNAGDSVRGTYRLMHAETSSGTAGFPAYSWQTTRSATALVT
jgi:hypothetical protein